MKVGRAQLFEEVWKEPMTKVALRYHVSSSFLARVCEQLNVPRPPRGYWAKLQVGIELARPPMPEPAPGGNARVDAGWHRAGHATDDGHVDIASSAATAV